MRMKHCDSCTCGLTEVRWSDREGYVDLNDPEWIADIVVNCALDRSYDRTATGVPNGFPDDLEQRLAPIVAKHLGAINPNWKNESVNMYDKPYQRDAFVLELKQVAKDFLASKD